MDIFELLDVQLHFTTNRKNNNIVLPRNLKSLRIAGQIFYVYLINNHVDFPVAVCPEKIFNFLPTGTVCSVNCLN